MVMGDLNVKVESGRKGKVVGPFGLGAMNERGEKLIHFCKVNNMTFMNTSFRMPKRRLCTWVSPQNSDA